MIKPVIKYSSGYKYQLRDTVILPTNICTGQIHSTPLVTLHENGDLEIQRYFAWDGCSGPTWDDSSNMRAGLVHDALYYLMRMGRLSIKYRSLADEELYRYMVTDGACAFRAAYYRYAVRNFAEKHALPESKRKLEIAP